MNTQSNPILPSGYAELNTRDEKKAMHPAWAFYLRHVDDFDTIIFIVTTALLVLSLRGLAA